MAAVVRPIHRTRETDNTPPPACPPVGTTHGGGEVGDAERKAELVNKGQSRDGDCSRPAILLALTARSTAVALIDCPECGRQISTAAEACPGCGHPNRPTAVVPVGPTCHACSDTATTKCQNCGALSCVAHVESVSVAVGGPYQLRCAECDTATRGWKIVQVVVCGLCAAFIWVLVFFSFRR